MGNHVLDYGKKLNRKEHDIALDVIKKEYSILLEISSIYISGSFWSIVLVIYNYSFLIHQDVILFYTTLLLRKDFQTASGVANYGVLIAFSIVVLINFHYFREDVLRLHYFISKGIFHYTYKQLKTTELVEFKKKIRFQKMALVFLAIYVCFIGIAVVTGPSIDNALGIGYPETYDENGVNRQIPVPLFFPFSTHQGLGHIVALACTTLSGCSCCAAIGGISMVFTICSHYVIIHLKKLASSINTLHFRAEYIYRKKYKDDTKFESLATIYAKEEFQDCINHCLVENIKHHHEIKRYSKLVQKVVRLPLMTSFCIVTVAIGLSMMKLNEDMDKVGSTVSFAMVAVAEILNMFNVAFVGETVLSVSEEVHWSIYFTPWHRFNAKNKKIVRLFLLGTQQPVSLRAWIVRMDMNMFASVVNTAYSYFNFLKLGKARESGLE